MKQDYSKINYILEKLSKHTEESESFFETFDTYQEVHKLTIMMRETEKYERDGKIPFYLKSLFSHDKIKNLIQ